MLRARLRTAVRMTRTLAHKTVHGARLATAARNTSAHVPDVWIFVVGVNGDACRDVHDLLAHEPGVSHLPGPGEHFTDQLLRPATMGVSDTWGISPVHFALDDADTTVNATRLLRQWCAALTPTPRAVAVELTAANAVRTRWLAKNVPGARFVQVTDPASSADDVAHVARISEILANDLTTLPRSAVVAVSAADVAGVLGALHTWTPTTR